MKVLDLATVRKMTLVAAESRTGGLLASLLIDVEGAGHAFERGFVTYSEAPSASCSACPRRWSMVAAPSASLSPAPWRRVRSPDPMAISR